MKIALLIILLFCHYLADYTHLSTPKMLAAKRTGSPLSPIAVHALVHAIIITSICSIYLQLPVFNMKYDIGDNIFLFEFITHFLIDTIKGKMNVWVPAVRDNSKYPHWYLFGIDQFLHQVVIVIIWYNITN